MELKLNKKTWIRKNELGPVDSRLLRPDNMQCCLGQFLSQIGISREEMYNLQVPAQLSPATQKKVLESPLSFLLTTPHRLDGRMFNSNHCNEIININDILSEDEYKIAEIGKILGQHNITLKVEE